MRRGNEEVCVLEMVRPGMEDSESGEKQENTGIGPGSACRGSPTPSRVPDAMQRGAERSGASLIRDRHGLERSTQVGLARLARFRAPILNPRSVSAAHHFVLRCARDTSEGPTCGCAKSRLGWFPCFRPVIYRDLCNSNVSGRREPNLLPKMYHPICHPRCGTIHRNLVCHHPSS